jgi:hypothetical protein
VLTFYLDEQVPELLAVDLRALAFDVVTANQQGNKGLHDGQQLLIAASAGRVIVTYNVKDFTLLHRSWRDWSAAWQVSEATRHAGIMLIYSSKGVGASVIASAIAEFAESVEELTNRLVAWHSSTGWRDVG